MFIAALFPRAKIRNQCRYSAMGEWCKKCDNAHNGIPFSHKNK
jgi:hypothetical protein